MKRRSVFAVAIIVFTVIVGYSHAVAKEEAASFDKKYDDESSSFLLYDVDVKVNNDWSYVSKIHKKIKILKDEAKNFGEISIYYDNGREKIVDIEAFTITPDNKKHKYSKIQDLSIYDGYPMYSDSRAKVITLPQVTVGAVLEHRYTIKSECSPIKNAFWHQAFADSSFPMKELRASITIPKKLGIRYKEFGLTRKPKVTEDKENITYAWVITDLEPNDDTEDYRLPPTPQSIKEGIEFSSISSWAEVSRWYRTIINKNTNITPDIEKAVITITKDKVTVKDKTRAILEYIQKDFRYVSMSFGDNALEPHPTDEVFKNKYGDCKDLSLLCKSMLSVAGIDSNICLFNTEFSISDPQHDLPIPTLFNHVILSVKDTNGESFYADPLLNGYDIEEYPAAYQGAYIFVINDTGGKFEKFPVFDEKKNYTGANRTIAIEEDGSALIEAESTWDLDFSIEQRRELNNLTKKQREEFYEGLDAYIAVGGKMIERNIIGVDQKYGIMRSSNKMKIKDAYPITGGLMIIDINGYERGTDFTKKERKNSIFYPLNSVNEEITTYTIPKGYVASYVPPNLSLDNGFFSIKREYVKGQNDIKLTEITRYKRAEVSREQYDKIRDFYDKLPTITQQRIILKGESSIQ